jgi:hypothetical protein
MCSANNVISPRIPTPGVLDFFYMVSHLMEIKYVVKPAIDPQKSSFCFYCFAPIRLAIPDAHARSKILAVNKIC